MTTIIFSGIRVISTRDQDIYSVTFNYASKYRTAAVEYDELTLHVANFYNVYHDLKHDTLIFYHEGDIELEVY